MDGFSQQRVIVPMFEYTWQKDFTESTPRLIIPMDDSAKQLIKNSFVKSMQKHWNIDLPDLTLDVKPLSFLASKPKFKTVIKDRDAASWYLFLQVYDKGNFSFFPEPCDDSLTTTLELKCRLINGSNDSLVFDRNLIVEIYRQGPPPDQVVLKRLPAYPPGFVQGFDSIANWLFDTTAVAQRSLVLKPACRYDEKATYNNPLSVLYFDASREGIHQLSVPEFSFQTLPVSYKKLDTKNNIGGNTAGGALTLLTGIQTNKRKSYAYQADNSFRDNDSIIHCMVNYVEVETAERRRETTHENGSKSYSSKSTEYRLLGRYIDTASHHTITMGNEVLVTFSIQYLPPPVIENRQSLAWNGSDSSTIMAMPKEWNNKTVEEDVFLDGKIAGDSFLMKTSKGTRIKDFYINDQLTMTLHGKPFPVKGFTWQPVPMLTQKLFTILASLPYSFYNYTSPD
jgi:hypothetical protein